MFRFALFVVSFDGLLLLVRDVKPTHLLKKQNNDRNEKKNNERVETNNVR